MVSDNAFVMLLDASVVCPADAGGKFLPSEALFMESFRSSH